MFLRPSFLFFLIFRARVDAENRFFYDREKPVARCGGTVAFATLEVSGGELQVSTGHVDNPNCLEALADQTMASLASLDISHGPSNTLQTGLTSTLDKARVSAGLQQCADVLQSEQDLQAKQDIQNQEDIATLRRYNLLHVADDIAAALIHSRSGSSGSCPSRSPSPIPLQSEDSTVASVVVDGPVEVPDDVMVPPPPPVIFQVPPTPVLPPPPQNQDQVHNTLVLTRAPSLVLVLGRHCGRARGLCQLSLLP